MDSKLFAVPITGKYFIEIWGEGGVLVCQFEYEGELTDKFETLCRRALEKEGVCSATATFREAAVKEYYPCKRIKCEVGVFYAHCYPI